MAGESREVKPRYAIVLRLRKKEATESQPLVQSAVVWCYEMPIPNSKVTVNGVDHIVVETYYPEFVMVKYDFDSSDWLVPVVTITPL